MWRGRERVAGFVKRWSTTPHIQPQSVAEHSFYVALYTDHICKLLNWPQPRRWHALHWALVHDMPEVVTGDIPGPVKRVIADKPKLRHVEYTIYEELGDGYDFDPTDYKVRNVVKAANLIDELFFLQNEVNLGNKYVHHVMTNTWIRLHRVLHDIGLDDLKIIISEELAAMADGIVSLKTEEDPHG